MESFFNLIGNAAVDYKSGRPTSIVGEKQYNDPTPRRIGNKRTFSLNISRYSSHNVLFTVRGQ